MASVDDVVFLLDVDNTLLDNDAVTADLRGYMREALGAEREQRYWHIFEECRSELGYADYLGALQRYRGQSPADCHLLEVSAHDGIREAGPLRPRDESDGDARSRPRH